MCFSSARKVDLIQLADAIYQQSNLAAELRFEFGDRCTGILEHVMQNCRDNRLRVHVHIGKELRYGNRMGNIGFAGQTCLPVMGVGAKFVCLYNPLDLLVRHIRL